MGGCAVPCKQNMPHPFHNFQQLTTARESVEDATVGVRWLFRL
jgi:hypothetical protein